MDFTDDDIQIERRIDELIDRGLERYGAGDMEGALAEWKHALALDPENERAANYLEYVEGHHDLGGDLSKARSESTVELSYPFGISTLGLAKLSDAELEDYESFEVGFAEAGGSEAEAKAPPSVDDGWNVDEGWVASLVQKAETAFEPGSSASEAADSESSEIPLPPPLESVDVPLESATGAESSAQAEPPESDFSDISLGDEASSSSEPSALPENDFSDISLDDGTEADMPAVTSPSSLPENDFSDISLDDGTEASAPAHQLDEAPSAEPEDKAVDEDEETRQPRPSFAEVTLGDEPEGGDAADEQEASEPETKAFVAPAGETDFSDIDLGDDDEDESEDIDLTDDDEPTSVLARPPKPSEKPRGKRGTAAPGDDAVTTHVHRPSAKIRALAGFDELELEPSDRDVGADAADEEEPTQAHVGRAGSGPHVRDVGADELDIDLDDDEDDEEESTQFHQSANRVGASHSAASDGVGLSIGELELDMPASEGPALPEVALPEIPRHTDAHGADDSARAIDFEDVPDAEELSVDAPYVDGGRMSEREAERRRAFASDEEMTIDRAAMTESPRFPRAPTQDHGISESAIRVDEALLSLQDSTRELDLGDMGLAPPGLGSPTAADAPEFRNDSSTRATRDLAMGSAANLELEEIDIRIGRAADLDAADAKAADAGEEPESPATDQSFLGTDDPTASTENGVLAEITRDAPRGDVGERMLYIVNRLIEHAGDEFTEGNSASAAEAVCQALDYASDSAVAQKLVFENERRLVQILIGSLGDAGQVPRLLCPLHEIPAEHINHRAAFLLTRLEQAMTLDELLDVSGMPKLEALRHLCKLHVLDFLEVV